MRSKIKLIAFVVSLIFIGTFSTDGISQGRLRMTQMEERVSTCEYIKNRLDYSLINSKENKDSYIIFIFRLGKSETQTGLTDSRIKLVKDYLKNRKGNLSQFVVATGEPNSDLGKVEIYSDGKLFSELVFKKDKSDKDFCVE